MNEVTKYIVEMIQHTVNEVAAGMVGVDWKEVQKALRNEANRLTKVIKEEKVSKADNVEPDVAGPHLEPSEVLAHVQDEPIIKTPGDDK